MDQFIRHVANRVWIKDLFNGQFIEKASELDSCSILYNNKKISRVYIIATVTQKFESDDMSYSSVTIDDGSADIRVKAWAGDVDIIANAKAGDLVLLIGKIKKYNDEIYIVPEILKKIDPNWELVHKSVLLQRPKEETTEVVLAKPEEIRFNDNL